VYRIEEMDQIEIRIEVPGADGEAAAAEVSRRIHNALGIRAEVSSVPAGTLPRFDLKARRFKDHRQMGQEQTS
ncbi:MAG TPA: phenylacetate--CoA ligase family protein, partial [Acidimicrobiia bacterium]|nr:phenylacetate--CoA ligase family protein [Acidimicrobiia bacterium]